MRIRLKGTKEGYVCTSGSMFSPFSHIISSLFRLFQLRICLILIIFIIIMGKPYSPVTFAATYANVFRCPDVSLSLVLITHSSDDASLCSGHVPQLL
ncbi:uncharacterized protein TEOVI_000599100 [Trypanosoma equiperdum]|uniref:Uncharacterized protein n=2 Tax=Trypanozoon TaxID=39700 RepID=Q38F33_TRYB2|nr:hypothetical protein, unlikely [Trypanosoma brucei brucei TREU927]EAN76587.1 hypothetical protein, unlikely [Trypanosoma brucei brucei TREU927]SCU67938.1 hypothetical protein, conserved [Trypanosoma equiperdum]